MEMGITADIDVKQVVRPFKSRNVVAALPGVRPAVVGRVGDLLGALGSPGQASRS